MPFQPFALEIRIGGLPVPKPLPVVCTGGREGCAAPDAFCCAWPRAFAATDAMAAVMMKSRRENSTLFLQMIAAETRKHSKVGPAMAGIARSHFALLTFNF